MNWLVWRQHRIQFATFSLILVIFAAITLLTGHQYWHDYQQAVATCVQNPANPSCSDLSGSMPQSYGVVVKVVFLTGLGIPLILGFFLGSPLFSREYEEGTNKLVWTQSVSRRKWLAAKLVWMLAFAALYGLAISLLISWWARTTNALDHSRFDTGQFDVQGIVPVAYSVFFVALGFTMSAWFRKTMIALAVMLGLFIAFQASFAEWVRPHYMTPITVTGPMGPDEIDSKIPTGAWMLKRDVIDKNGKVFNSFDLPNMPANCRNLIVQVKSNGNAIKVRPAPGNNGNGDPIDTCLNNAGYREYAQYQPSYRYWEFQEIESAIYLGMAAVAIAATYWLVLKRDA